MVSFAVGPAVCCTPRVRASYSTTDTFAQLLSVDDSSRRRVSPVCSSGLDRPRTLHSMYYTVLYCIAHGSSSLSPCGLVLVAAASSASAFLHFLVSLECARLDVREFYDLYWINKPLVGGAVDP